MSEFLRCEGLFVRDVLLNYSREEIKKLWIKLFTISARCGIMVEDFGGDVSYVRGGYVIWCG